MKNMKWFLVFLAVFAFCGFCWCDTEQPEIVLGYGAGQIEFREGMALSNIRLRGSRFVGKQLRRCLFENCDFSGSVFRDCDLGSVTFKGCNLTDVEMTQCEVSNASFEDTIVNGLTCNLTPRQFKDTFSFQSRDLRRCRIWGDENTAFDFKGVNLEGAVFWGDMRNCDFTDANIQNVEFHCKINAAQFESTKDYKRKLLVGIDFYTELDRAIDLTGVEIWQCRFGGGRLDDARIAQSEVIGLGVDEVLKTREFREGFVDSVTFVSIDFKDQCFDNMDLSGCVFIKCDLTGATFSGAVVSGTRFTRCKGFARKQLGNSWNAANGRMDSVGR